MNIFRLDDDPSRAAKFHCDSHCVKMILETAQLLSTAHGGGEGLCKPTHVNHPCAVWARESSGNYDWLWQLGVLLTIEYTHRYGRTHAYDDMLLLDLARVPAHVPTGPQTPQPMCMPEQYKGPNVVEAYRRYYLGEKLRFARWRYSERPSWVTSEQ